MDNRESPSATETGGLAPVSDIRSALTFLTRLPVGGPHRALDRCAWAFPLAGLAVGGLGATGFWVCLWLGLGPWLGGALCLAVTAFLTGALHEDGLADSADGLGGGATKDRKLEIMRDSRMGAYGALALILITVGKLGALERLYAVGGAQAALFGIVAAHVLARGILPAVMAALPLASASGVAASAGRPGAGIAGLAILLATALVAALVGPIAALILCGAAGLKSAAIGTLVRRLIGGYNGDALGLIEQAGEIVTLAVLIILLVHLPALF